MAFNLGKINEEKKNYKTCIKYYKRFFFCARILEDPVGASLALNRLGVAYHKLKNYERSLQFHLKHKQFCDTENMFAALYNIGVSCRLLRQYENSIEAFQNALEWSNVHNVL
jgi:tetratricopeptide (TPR) repeat protein